MDGGHNTRNKEVKGKQKPFNVPGNIWKTRMSAQIDKRCLLGVETVLRLERDAWSMAKGLKQATGECTPPVPFLIFCLAVTMTGGRVGSYFVQGGEP